MAQQLFYHGQRYPREHQPRCERMPQVVEPAMADAGLLDRLLEGCSHRFGGLALPVEYQRASTHLAFQYLADGLIYRYLPLLTALCPC